MNALTTAPGFSLRMCETCGATRVVSDRYRVFRMICHGECQGKTVHDRIYSPEEDFREAQNRQGDVGLQNLQRDLDFIRGLGVEVRFAQLKPEYHGAEVTRFVEDGHVRVTIEDSYNVADRHEALRWAWRYLLPGYKAWLEAEVYGTGREANYGVHRA